MMDLVHFAPWTCCAQAPGASAEPAAVQGDWFAAEVPGTVASALRARGQWNHQCPPDVDAQDWWYRTSFAAAARTADEACVLCCDGLASLADVWLNGELILSSNNMFRSYRVNVAQALKDENELVICFRSLTTDLKKKRPRPRWKTNLVNN